MAEVRPIVSDVSIGNATVGIDCVWIKCIESVTFRMGMEEVPIVCDWVDGPSTHLRGNRTGNITINAKNLNETSLKYALDATTSTKAGDETVSCEEHTITWTPDSATTPTEWTATVTLNSPEIASVLAYTDSSCSVAWESATTPLNVLTISSACKGEITLTTDDVNETDETLYFSYTHDTESPVGSTLIQPSLNTFADEHKVHILHRNATTGDLYVYKFWRVQIIPDFEQTFNDSNSVVITPINMRVLSDSTNHPDDPLGHVVIIPTADSEASDFTYDIYKRVRQ